MSIIRHPRAFLIPDAYYWVGAIDGGNRRVKRPACAFPRLQPQLGSFGGADGKSMRCGAGLRDIGYDGWVAIEMREQEAIRSARFERGDQGWCGHVRA